MRTIISIIIFQAILLSACDSRPKQFLSKTYGQDADHQGMILIAYDSRAGSTIEIADSIAFAIAHQGYRADLMHITDVSDVSGYSAIVIGSSIRRGQITPDILKFVELRKNDLEAIPTAFFIACLSMMHDTPENRERVARYLDPVREFVQPYAEGYFAGKMDYSKLNRYDRFLVKRKVKAPEGDFRDWNKIKEWGQRIVLKF